MYEYTTPRAPIAAMYGSPGPVYKLPSLCGQLEHDPRSIYNKAPAYQFGNVHGKFSQDCSPGPCYNPSSNIGRYGREASPAFTLSPRTNLIGKSFSPGPGAYIPDDSRLSNRQKAAAFSFGLRSANNSTDSTPAPNVYNLDDMLGPRVIRSNKRTAPNCSITGRSNVGSFAEDLKKTPGPGTYQTINAELYKVSLPKITITGRHNMPGDNTQKPGPGTYRPEKVTLSMRQAPASSFGIRHSQYKGEYITDADRA